MVIPEPDLGSRSISESVNFLADGGFVRAHNCTEGSRQWAIWPSRRPDTLNGFIWLAAIRFPDDDERMYVVRHYDEFVYPHVRKMNMRFQPTTPGDNPKPVKAHSAVSDISKKRNAGFGTQRHEIGPRGSVVITLGSNRVTIGKSKSRPHFDLSKRTRYCSKTFAYHRSFAAVIKKTRAKSPPAGFRYVPCPSPCIQNLREATRREERITFWSRR